MNGLLILDKPAGMTSHDVVARVRRATGEKSIGHLGTLDPMATGLLPLLLGKYTRLAQFFTKAEKSYTGTIRFGWATDTFDAEGVQVGDRVHPGLTLESVRAAASGFFGEIEQVPPAYSAKKVEGTPAYKLARAGKAVELKACKIHILHFAIESMTDDLASFSMRISAGGYVRSVAHELGSRLGCGAHLASLRRTAAGDFSLADALSLEALESLGAKAEQHLPHPRTLLMELPSVSADAMSAGRLRNGMQVNLPEYSSAPLVKIFEGQSSLIAIGRRIAGTLFQPIVVLG